MSIFKNLFQPKPLDSESIHHLNTLTKVGLAFLSGSDGGSIIVSANTKEIRFELICRANFFHYADDLGISEATLLENGYGQCPLDLWEYFKRYVDIYATPYRNGDGHEIEMNSSMEMPEQNTRPYLASLKEYLLSTYSDINVSVKDNSISILVPQSIKKNFTYR